MDKQEPYRATKLWNEVICDFRNGMPVKKHWRRIQFYNDCFTASDCITWLHYYLQNNPNFGHDVSRQQTMQLLQKFLKCHVIESISLKTKKNEFLDDSHLYRFTQLPPSSFKTIPLQQIQSPASSGAWEKLPKEENKVPNAINILKDQKENIPECHFIQKRLTITQIHNTWKDVVLFKLEGLLSPLSAEDILDIKLLNGSHVKYNMSRISKTGVVMLIDKTDDIPHWVTSAMKCLVNWPNASGSGSCLPNYPGFEKDVFKVVRDFFINPQVPLLSESLSKPLVKIFGTFLKKSCFEAHYSELSKQSDLSPIAGNLIPRPKANEIMTSTPIVLNDIAKTISPENLKFCKSIEGKILLDDPEAMWDFPSNVCFETEFSTNLPVTRVVAEKQSAPNLCKASAPSLVSLNSVSTISVCSRSYKDAENECYRPVGRTSYETHSKLWNSAIDLNRRIPFQQSNVVHNSNKLRYSSENGINSPSSGYLHHGRKSQSFCDYVLYNEDFRQSCCFKDTSSVDMTPDFYDDEKSCLNDSCLSSKTITENEYAISNRDEMHKITNHYPRCDSKCELSSRSNYKLQNGFNVDLAQKERRKSGFLDLAEINKKLVEIFQLILLFLPPPNRRQLHLLLRVINKMIKGKFIIDTSLSMKDYLLQTFQPAIVQSESDPTLIIQLTSFLLSNCEDIFLPLSAITKEVEENLLRASSGKIKYSLDDPCVLTYCELVSKQQYEEQKMSSSAQALKGLLESIIQDVKLTEKERRKKLKKFKENHPEIYFLCFPQPEERKQKPKKTILSKLANLRL